MTYLAAIKSEQLLFKIKILEKNIDMEQTISCLCLGPKGAGKSHLLSSLQCSESINFTSYSVQTAGTNLFTINLPETKNSAKNKKNNIKKVINIREVGGLMASLWKNYLTNIEKILYVVDTSNLCQISAAGVLFYSLLAEPRLQRTKIALILTKMDLAYRQMRNEALLILQLNRLKKEIRQNITVFETSALSEMGKDKILAWLAE